MASFILPFNFGGIPIAPAINLNAPKHQFTGTTQASSKLAIPTKNCINSLGGVFTNGKPLPDFVRQEIIRLSVQGVKSCGISRQLKVSHGCVSKILSRFHSTGSAKPASTGGSRPKVATDDVISAIVELKKNNPDMFAREILETVIEKGICSKESAPSISSVNRILRRNSLSNKTVVEQQGFNINHQQQQYSAPITQQPHNTQQLVSHSDARFTNNEFSGLKRKLEETREELEIHRSKIRRTDANFKSPILPKLDNTDANKSVANILPTKQPDQQLSGKAGEKVDGTFQVQVPMIASVTPCNSFMQPVQQVIETENPTSFTHTAGETAQPHQAKLQPVSGVPSSIAPSSNSFTAKIDKLKSQGFPYFHPAMGWMNLIPISYETMADLGLPLSIMSDSSDSIFYDGSTIPEGAVTGKAPALDNNMNQLDFKPDLQTKATQVSSSNDTLGKEDVLKCEVTVQMSGVAMPNVRRAEQTTAMANITVPPPTFDVTQSEMKDTRLAQSEEFPSAMRSCSMEGTSGSGLDLSLSAEVKAESRDSVDSIDLSDALDVSLDETGSSLDFSDEADSLETPTTVPFHRKIESKGARKKLFPELNHSI